MSLSIFFNHKATNKFMPEKISSVGIHIDLVKLSSFLTE